MQDFSIHPHPTSGNYCLDDDYTITIRGCTITVPAGFEFDGASIPPFFWLAFHSPYHPKVVRAALIHDYLYVTHEVDKAEADLTFVTILGIDGVDKWRRKNMWRAVHLFGGKAWERRSQYGLKS